MVFPILLALAVCNPLQSTPGNPSLPVVILATHSGFGTYTAEILKTEGFNEFLVDSLTNPAITLRYLKTFDLVILGETSVTASHKKMLADYVRAGGNLIAFRPDKQLCEIFGLADRQAILSEGYIRINVSEKTGRGLSQETIQFHGNSDVYGLQGAEPVAMLYSDAGHSTGFPAVVTNHYGKGNSAAFTFNLPKSIVFTRQGNPAWAGEERDKVDGPTATDLFFPARLEAQWNNPEKIAIPQADEQMRLLSHIIERFSSYKKPLPRFWYFPDRYQCMFIFTIDGEDTPESDINKEIAEVNGKGAKATLYEIGTYIKPETVNTWRTDGNEVAIHYNDVPEYANPTWLNMNAVLDTMTTNFRKVYGISPKTARNHWVVWCSKDQEGKKQFAEQAILEEKYGIGLDCNYYQFGGNKVYPNWIGDVGHFTGSGLPMKFADDRGRILDIYQSNTQLPDETWLKENIEIKCKTLIDRSLDEENYTYINANFHTWYWSECRIAGLRVLDYCNSRKVPVRTAENANEFLRMKDEATFSNLSWSRHRLSFLLSSALAYPGGLTFLLPMNHGNLKIGKITINSENRPFEHWMMKGYEYALITVTPGKAYQVAAEYR